MYSFILFRYNLIFNVILLSFVTYVYPNVIQLNDEATFRELTLNFYRKLQNTYFNSGSVSYKRGMSDDISQFEDRILRNIRNAKENVEYPTYGERLYQNSDSDSYPFKNFMEYGMLKTMEIKDIVIFSHKHANLKTKENGWFAGIILDNLYNQNGSLIIYEFIPKDNTWKILQTENVERSSMIRSLSTPDGTILITAHESDYENFNNGITVFLLNYNNKIEHMQDLYVDCFSNLALWSTADNIFLMAAIDHVKHGNNVVYEAKNPLYVWKGRHFDILQYIDTMNVKKIMPFCIGTTHYVAIANNRNNYGQREISSEIFKYEPQLYVFVPFQKIPTNGAIDLNYISYQWNSFIETFVVIVNEYYKENEFYTNSVLYKYDNELFAPFQHIPVYNVIRWLPMADDSKSILLGLTDKNDIEIFQYNGWKFVRMKQFDKLKQLSGKFKINYFTFYRHPILLITHNYNGESTNYFYKPTFDTINPLSGFKDKIGSWCQKLMSSTSYFGRKYFASYDSSRSLIRGLKQLETLNDTMNKKGRAIILKEASVESIYTESVYSDDFEFNQFILHNINDLMSSFSSQLASVRTLQEILSLTMSNKMTINIKSMKIKHLQLSCFSRPCYLRDINLTNINGKDIDYYQKEIIYVENGFQNYNELIIDNLIIKYRTHVKSINKKSLDDVKKILQTIAENNGLIVRGSLYLDKGFSLSGKLANIKFNEESLLLKVGNQYIKGDLYVCKLISNILEVPIINDVVLSDFRASIDSENRTLESSSIMKLTVDDVFMDKDVFHRINSSALKLNGDQIVKSPQNIHNLKCGHILLNDAGFKAKLVDNFVKITSGHYSIKQDTRFDQLTAKSLTVVKRFNNIPVVGKNLDVLLTDSNAVQKLTGDKVFENVELIGPVKLQGRINEGILEKKNPITMIDRPLILRGNFVILGNVSVESLMNCDNLVNSERELSVKFLQQRGLKLSDEQIDIPLAFTEPLEAGCLSIDTVNGVDPRSWITTESDLKTVTGKKIFVHDLEIRGSCSMPSNINNVESASLRNIMTVYDDQEITGNVFIANVSTQRLQCGDAIFGKKSYEHLINVRNNYTIKEAIVEDTVTVHDKAFADQSLISGTVNDWNIQYLVEDTILSSDVPLYVPVDLKMKDLTVVNLLYVDNVHEINVREIESWMNWKKEVLLHGPIYLDGSLNANTIEFDLSVSGISKADFGRSWLLDNGDQTVHGSFIFDTIGCANMSVETNKINDLDLTELFDSVIWLDGSAELNNVRFTKDPSVKKLILNDYLNYVKRIDDFVLKKPTPLIFTGYKVFRGKVNVDKEIHASAVCNVALKEFCAIVSGEVINPSVHIKGNLKMRNEPIVQNIFGVKTEDLMNTIWFLDVQVINANNIFKNLICRSSVSLKGSLNEYDLNWLQDNYISLNRDQIIGNVLHVSELITDVLYVGETVTKSAGRIGNLYLNTLNVNGPQKIVGRMKFEAINGKVYIYNTVNDIDVSVDLMRISSANDVIGYKTFESVVIADLNSVSIQNIDVRDWIENSVKIGAGYSMTDVKTILSANFGNLNILGRLNGKSTDYLMRNASRQIFNGKIEFNADVSFDSCSFKRNVNGIDVNDALNNIILQYRDAVFTEPKILSLSMYSQNTFVGGLFNGESFSGLVSSIDRSEGHDFRNEFLIIANHTDRLAHDYYESCAKIMEPVRLVQVIKGGVRTVSLVQNLLGRTNSYLITTSTNHRGLSKIHYIRWYSVESEFINDQSIAPLSLDGDLINYFIIDARSMYLYAEINSINAEGILGSIYKYRDGYFKIQDVMKKRAQSVASFNETCFVVVTDGPVNLHCLDGSTDTFELSGSIMLRNPLEVTSFKTSGVVYLISKYEDRIEVFQWVEGEKLSSVQTLQYDECCAFLEWSNTYLIAVRQSSKIIIYRFEDDLHRFITLQSMASDTALRIDLKAPDRMHAFLSLLTIDKEGIQKLSIYQYRGIAKFQLVSSQNVNAHVTDMAVMSLYNAHIVALSSSDRIMIFKSRLKN